MSSHSVSLLDMDNLELGMAPDVQLDTGWHLVQSHLLKTTGLSNISPTLPSILTSSAQEQRTIEDVSNVEYEEINADLSERFSRISVSSQSAIDTVTPNVMLDTLPRPNIREYFDQPLKLSADSLWLTIPEIPTSKEIGHITNGVFDEDDIHVPVNNITSAWPGRQEYLRTHYELLREDSVASLRLAVAELRAYPNINEKASREGSKIYENVRITGVMFSTHGGIAVRVEFSLGRIHKQVLWEQSKRLRSGSLVALTKAEDKFQTICKVAVVAARPLEALRQTPPSIDLFFNSTDELEIDPQQEWLMVEAGSGYFESQKHTLLALQKMSTETFPMVSHIVELQEGVRAPNYVQNRPSMDLSAVSSDPDAYICANVLEGWPKLLGAELDESQVTALRQILTKRLAIIQGPPGTGKTHVSVVALKVILSNMIASDPPMIITAHTNHALDQLLRHIAVFEPDFIRLGGRTTDQAVIKPRTLWEIKQRTPPKNNGSLGRAAKARKLLAQEMAELLKPLVDSTQPLTAEFFESCGLLTVAQVKSLHDHAENWGGVSDDRTGGLMGLWLENSVILKEKGIYTNNHHLELEEVDLEFEQLQELEAESGGKDDDSHEMLRGEWVPLVEPFTGRNTKPMRDAMVEGLLRDRQDLYRIHTMQRGPIYCYLQKKGKEQILKHFRVSAAKYNALVRNVQIAKWERDYAYLRRARIIGMTTTGLSKNRALISSLQPRVVLIEEAAETLEAHVIPACLDSLQHLILVGDHQQLRGQCSVKDLEGPPFNLDVSMFERLVNNNVEFVQLTRQRRMRPEIRKLISPIYENLRDHPCVEDREDIPGMGGVNTFFYTHSFPESNDDMMSKKNAHEADLVIGLFDYLVLNGMDVKDITVLTFYNGQRKMILHGLKTHPNFQGSYHFNVVTVDSYQGEENEVVILSLVRNNSSDIGFLSVENRVCVALSRARRGFYLFGNDKLLGARSPLWEKVLMIFQQDSCRIGRFLPLTCTKHGKRTNIKLPSDWDIVNGGCKQVCSGLLPCGHKCGLKCHPFSHDVANCRQKCSKIQDTCGHPCLELCHVKPCRCICGKRAYTQMIPGIALLQAAQINAAHTAQAVAGEGQLGETPMTRAHSRGTRSFDLTEEAQEWTAFAAGGHRGSDAKIREASIQAVRNAERERVDTEMERALFAPSSEGPEALKIAQTMAEGGEIECCVDDMPGKKKVWKTVWTTPRSEVREGHERERSLLD